MMTEMNHVIRRYMDDKNISVKKLSEETNIGRVNLGYKLHGKRQMSVQELSRIVKYLGISEKDLLKGMTL